LPDSDPDARVTRVGRRAVARAAVESGDAMIVTPRALKLIMGAESLNQPGKVPPLESSGITIGYGDDLGQISKDDFKARWFDCIPRAHFERLRSVIGMHGALARGAALGLRDIVITPQAAMKAFNRMLDSYAAETLKAFPGLETYPPDAQGAILSLVINRGDSMGKSSLNRFDGRQEMRDLRDAIARGATCEELGDIVMGMAPLWSDQGVDGLVERRMAEGALIKAADDPPGLAA
jgi:hypothetical protein